jgi:hypothetical protein
MNLSKKEENLLVDCGLLVSPDIALSWDIIKHKLMYYRPDLVHSSWYEELSLSDAEYDALEAEYKSQAKSYTTNTVGIDLDRPSVRLVISKYSKARP